MKSPTHEIVVDTAQLFNHTNSQQNNMEKWFAIRGDLYY